MPSCDSSNAQALRACEGYCEHLSVRLDDAGNPLDVDDCAIARFGYQLTASNALPPPGAVLENDPLSPRVTLLPNHPCFPINTKRFRRSSVMTEKKFERALDLDSSRSHPSSLHGLTSARGLSETDAATYRRQLMAACSVSGRVSTGPRRGATWSRFDLLIPRLSPPSRRSVTIRGRGTGNVSPLTPYTIPFHAPIGNSYSRSSRSSVHRYPLSSHSFVLPTR